MSALINWDHVVELRDELGTEEFAEVVELFLEDVDDRVSNLGAEGRCVEFDLHSLKGSALNLGFIEFSENCSAGEAAAAAGHADQVDLEAVVSSYGVSRDAFLSGLAEKRED